MSTRTLAVSTLFAFALSGAALAQTPAGGGSAEGNMNNPGSVKSSTQKAMEGTAGVASETGGGAGVSAPGAPAGNSMGQGTTGSGAAPGAR